MRIAGLSISEIPRVLMGSGERAGGGGGAARRFCGSWMGGGVVLVVLCLAVYLPGLVGIPPVDRDESRFAQASRQMYESGDYVVPRVQDRPRLNKPPLIYWLQCVSIAVFGDREGQYANANIWVFRVPSVLCAMAAVVLTWRLGARMFDARAGLLGGAMLAVCPMVVWDAHQARADQLLLACTTAAMCALWCVWKREAREAMRPGPKRERALGERLKGWLTAAAFWVAIGLGILAKGPITPLVAGLTVLAVSIATRRWRWIRAIRPIEGVVIVCATVGWWVWAVGERVGWRTYLSTVFDETIGRSGGAKEGHWGPPGYHLVVLVVLFWPGVLMTAAALGRAVRRVWPDTRPHPPHFSADSHQPEGQGAGASLSGVETAARSRLGVIGTIKAIAKRTDSTRPELFLLCWIGPAWLVFELIATKLPHYTLPMYPAIALLSARAVLGMLGRLRTRAVHLGEQLWLLVGVVLSGIGAAVALVALISPADDPKPSMWLAGSALVCSAFAIYGLIWCFKWFRSDRVVFAQCVSIPVAAAIVGAWMMSGPPRAGLVPGGMTPLAIESLKAGRTDFMSHPIATVFHEDSVIFWTRGKAERIEESDVDSWFRARPEGSAIVPIPNGFSALHERGYVSGHLFLLGSTKYTTIRRREPEP